MGHCPGERVAAPREVLVANCQMDTDKIKIYGARVKAMVGHLLMTLMGESDTKSDTPQGKFQTGSGASASNVSNVGDIVNMA